MRQPHRRECGGNPARAGARCCYFAVQLRSGSMFCRTAGVPQRWRSLGLHETNVQRVLLVHHGDARALQCFRRFCGCRQGEGLCGCGAKGYKEKHQGKPENFRRSCSIKTLEKYEVYCNTYWSKES
ncbi:hypothetical protein ANCCAN_11740 [Ancylostoma caninum]|uniref:Uncharacterized protein n=1 Tax=Ancylostoma caninum TaxID=29170 RepID=A0A368GD20_ANCCA|nr:hypothetical protein ANCCAN_11740 [Ancylostoma caninum]